MEVLVLKLANSCPLIFLLLALFLKPRGLMHMDMPDHMFKFHAVLPYLKQVALGRLAGLGLHTALVLSTFGRMVMGKRPVQIPRIGFMLLGREL